MIEVKVTKTGNGSTIQVSTEEEPESVVQAIIEEVEKLCSVQTTR